MSTETSTGYIPYVDQGAYPPTQVHREQSDQYRPVPPATRESINNAFQCQTGKMELGYLLICMVSVNCMLKYYYQFECQGNAASIYTLLYL